ncbi:hypothetical protein [Bradyrhizobium iriomotense]|uniref:Uncharacterized protein n=1 Tax=Bradyrhizobium iriomotense TaxID=441950 RepID=A0ABQ6AQA9_9BRAD|nr:hypothetical protein [Bradyrhizobium iriomotense]GLR84447.1 hypothetical protein GCM10007857_11570 [Bradyrhizobium iriomotense]
MNIRALCGVLILGVTAAIAPSTPSPAQSDTKGVAAPKDTGAATPGTIAPNTNTNPTKYRYWRHRGGKHPHYGSRRVRT